jgi:hypothetical protein
MVQAITIFVKNETHANRKAAVQALIDYIENRHFQHLMGLALVDRGKTNINERYQLVLVVALEKLRVNQNQALALLHDLGFHQRDDDHQKTDNATYAVFSTRLSPVMPNMDSMRQTIHQRFDVFVNKKC